MSLMIYLRKKYVSYIKIQDIIFFSSGSVDMEWLLCSFMRKGLNAKQRKICLKNITFLNLTYD